MFSVTLPQTRLIFLKEIGQTLIKENLFLNYFSIDWYVALKLDEQKC